VGQVFGVLTSDSQGLMSKTLRVIAPWCNVLSAGSVNVFVFVVSSQDDWLINCQEWHVDIVVLHLSHYSESVGTIKYDSTYNVLQCLHNTILARVLVNFSMTRSQII